MKVFIATDWYSPAINGVVTSVKNLENELQREGHEVLILTLSGSRQTYQDGNVIYVGSLNMEAIYPKARLRLLFSDKWMRTVLGWKPDVVHSQCEFNTFGIAKRIARRLDIPLVHTYHTIYEDYTHYFSPNRKMGKSAAREFTRRICREVDHVIAPSEKTAALLREYEVESDVTVIPSGLVMDRFSHRGLIAKSTLGIPEDQTVLLYLGRLAKEKNLDEIFQYLQSWRGRAITFLIVGDGPYRGALEEQAKRLPESVTVRFTGMVPPDSVPSYYSLGDLFVSASQSETQGLTYIEAAAAGLPLLCRQDPCLKDVVVEGANGWQYQSKQDFLEKLKMFTETDFLRHNEMGICSKYLANRFDIRKTVPRIAEVYEASISQRKRKAGEFIHGCGECR